MNGRILTDFESVSERAQKDLTRLFKQLRKRGFVARQRVACCRGCADGELDTEENKGKPCVFTINQDYPLVSKGELARGEASGIYLPYGIIGEELDQSYTLVGHIVQLEAEAIGLETSWDGDPNQCVYVMFKQEVETY